MPDVFISFSRRDIDFVRHLFDQPKARDREPWAECADNCGRRDKRWATTTELYDSAWSSCRLVWNWIIGNYYRTQVNKPETGNINADFTFNRDSEAEGKLVIYAYDLKLSEYMTYNLSIKPNAYQPPPSTVDNGYGCFGSFNMLERVVEFWLISKHDIEDLYKTVITPI